MPTNPEAIRPASSDPRAVRTFTTGRLPFLVIKYPATAAHLIASGFHLDPLPLSDRGDGRWAAPLDARSARDHYEKVWSAIQADLRRRREPSRP